MSCDCGSEKTYELCCEPLIRGERKAESPEALMRARYSAYVRGEIDFLIESQSPDKREELDRSDMETWSKESEWLGLRILECKGAEDAPDDVSRESPATVEFLAMYRRQGQEIPHHELASFIREGGTWYFDDSLEPRNEPVRREEPKHGRNDPCPCGSGKKFKKCCGKA